MASSAKLIVRPASAELSLLFVSVAVRLALAPMAAVTSGATRVVGETEDDVTVNVPVADPALYMVSPSNRACAVNVPAVDGTYQKIALPSVPVTAVAIWVPAAVKRSVRPATGGNEPPAAIS